MDGLICVSDLNSGERQAKNKTTIERTLLIAMTHSALCLQARYEIIAEGN
jgi:hypothetical protein